MLKAEEERQAKAASILQARVRGGNARKTYKEQVAAAKATKAEADKAEAEAEAAAAELAAAAAELKALEEEEAALEAAKEGRKSIGDRIGSFFGRRSSKADVAVDESPSKAEIAAKQAAEAAEAEAAAAKAAEEKARAAGDEAAMKDAAARKIGAIARGRKARAELKKAEEERERAVAATKVQAAMRGKAERKDFEERKAKAKARAEKAAAAKGQADALVAAKAAIAATEKGRLDAMKRSSNPADQPKDLCSMLCKCLSGPPPISPEQAAEDANLINSQGLQFNARGDSRAALNCFLKAGALQPLENRYLLSAANMHVKLGEGDAAVAIYEWLLTLPMKEKEIQVAQAKLEEAQAVAAEFHASQ